MPAGVLALVWMELARDKWECELLAHVRAEGSKGLVSDAALPNSELDHAGGPVSNSCMGLAADEPDSVRGNRFTSPPSENGATWPDSGAVATVSMEAQGAASPLEVEVPGAFHALSSAGAAGGTSDFGSMRGVWIEGQKRRAKVSPLLPPAAR